MAFSVFIQNLWNKAKRSDTFIPTYFEIPVERTDEEDCFPEEFDDKRHYFMLSVNEMFLSYDRLWYQQFSPMVFSVCKFNYNGGIMEIPYVIGPSNLEKYEKPLPEGMLFLNTPVVGVHPWRGGNVSVSLILCRVKRQNNAETLLNVVEDLSNSLDFAAGLSTYTKIGRVVLNGFDSLLGFQQTSPLLGINNNFGQASGNTFRPGYHVLIHADNLDEDKFWVKENRLHYGNDLDSADHYRDNDFILLKIGISENRDDEESLAYYAKYKDIYEYIRNQVELDEKQLANLKTRLRNLAVEIKTSPDLAEKHADWIWEKKVEEIQGFVERLNKLDGTKAKGKFTSKIDMILDNTINEINF